jgi:hypothetical protein
VRACGHAAEVADKLGNATALAQAALGFCGPHRIESAAAETQPVAELLERALAALDDDNAALRAQLMGRLGTTLTRPGLEHRQLTLAHRALEIARQVNDGTTLADVIASYLWVTRGPDTLHESMVMAKELVRVTDEVGDHRLRAAAHWWLIEILLELGEIDAVEHELQALQRLNEARTEHYFKGLLATLLATHA